MNGVGVAAMSLASRVGHPGMYFYESNRLVYRSARISTRCETASGYWRRRQGTRALRDSESAEEGPRRPSAGHANVGSAAVRTLLSQQERHALRDLPGLADAPEGIFEKSKLGTTSATRSVSVIPGETELTRMPWDASSSTAPAWKEFSAPLLMAYSRGRPMTAEPLLMLTTDPPAPGGGFPSTPRGWTCGESPPCSTAPDRRRSRA